MHGETEATILAESDHSARSSAAVDENVTRVERVGEDFRTVNHLTAMELDYCFELCIRHVVQPEICWTLSFDRDHFQCDPIQRLAFPRAAGWKSSRDLFLSHEDALREN